MSSVRKYETEVVRRIYDNDEGVYVEVGPDSDALGLVELRTGDKASEDYYGKLRFTMTKEQAIAVGHALIAAAAEVKE